MAKRRGSGDGSIQRRGKNRWRVSVELGPDPITGKRRRYRFSVKGTRKDALRALRKALSERDHSGVDPDEITTEEWLVRWLEERVRDEAIGPNSEYNYVRILWKHLIPAIGNVRLQDLRAAQIRELKTRLSQSLKPGTVKKILGLLRQSLQAAVTLQLLASNPASAVPSPSLKRDRKEHRALNKEESERLVEVAKGTPYAMVIRFALGTGVRQGELLGATWDAIDLERREFRVVQTLQIVKGEFQLLPPKTDRGRRTITLSRKLVKRLRKHRRKQNAARLELGQAWEDRDLVFPNGRGGYWHRVVFYRHYRELVDTSGIARPKEVKFHTLRHTAASHWLKAGADLLAVSRRLDTRPRRSRWTSTGTCCPGSRTWRPRRSTT